MCNSKLLKAKYLYNTTKKKTIYLNLKLVIKSYANYLYNIDSFISTKYYIFTVKTSLFLLIFSIFVGLLIAFLLCINLSIFDLIIITT
jgi:hypothetical protein